MSDSQLSLFQRKIYKGIVSSIPMEIQAPHADMTVIQTLPAYYTYLQSGGFSKYTPDDFTGDLKKFGLFVKEKLIKDITDKDIRSWISFLKTPTPKGEGLSAKTISRKLTALGNYFLWLVSNEVIKEKGNPMLDIANSRISSPLPDILFEDECTKLLTTASNDPGVYLLFLLLLETGIKLEELFSLKISHFDFSNKYSPEMYINCTSRFFYNFRKINNLQDQQNITKPQYIVVFIAITTTYRDRSKKTGNYRYIKHTGKKEKKSRKLKLPIEIISVFTDYVDRYKVDGSLFPYTQRFVRYLITETTGKAGVKKKVSAQILRDTCAVRQLRRGEGIEKVLQRLGLSETIWEDAKEKYLKLSKGGI